MRHASIGGERRVLPVNFAVLLALVLCCVSGKSIASENNTSIVLFEQGNHYYEKGEYDKAIADYSRSIELDPNSAGAYLDRGIVYEYTKEYDKAIGDYTKAIGLEPNYSSAFYKRWYLYSLIGETSKASNDFNTYTYMINDYDDDLPPHPIYEDKGDHAKAEADWRKAD